MQGLNKDTVNLKSTLKLANVKGECRYGKTSKLHDERATCFIAVIAMSFTANCTICRPEIFVFPAANTAAAFAAHDPAQC